MRNRKLLITALSLMLCLGVSIGSAVAYFTDYEAAKGGAVVHLSGRTETSEDVDESGKTIVIKNTGDVDMIARVMVYGDEKNMTINAEGNEDWVDGGDGAWYYTKVIPAGGESSALRAEVKGRTDDADPVNFDIVVVHESSRVIYDQDDEGNNIVAKPDAWEGCPDIEAAE